MYSGVCMMRKLILPAFRIMEPLLMAPRLGDLFPVKTVYWYLLNHLKDPSAIADIQGHKMHLDPDDTLALSVRGIHEPIETGIINREIQKGDIVLDIGANIGYYTLIAARLVGPEGKVFAFEPDPMNFNLLKKNVEMNGYRNVVLVNKAVASKTEKLRLFLSEENKADHRIYDSHDGRLSIEIDAIRMDDFLADSDGRIDFIKMDIQGAEGGAVQGMPILLEKNRRLKMVTEFWPFGLKQFGVEPSEYIELFVKHGFVLYEIDERRKSIQPADIARILKTCTPENRKFTNLFCVRSS